MTIHTDQEEVKTRRLNVTIACQAVYSSSIDVPADLSLEDALKYAKEHISEIPLTSLEYIPDSDVLDEENCDFEDLAVDMEIKLEVGMTGNIKTDPGIKKALRGKSFVVKGVDEQGAYATCSIDGRPGTYAVARFQMENLTTPEKKLSLSERIAAAEAAGKGSGGGTPPPAPAHTYDEIPPEEDPVLHVHEPPIPPIPRQIER